MLNNSTFAFAISSNSGKWCEVICIVIPELSLDPVKYSQSFPLWEINLSLVHTRRDNSQEHDHKVYYFCCMAGRWLIGDLINQEFAPLSHPLLDKLKIKILEKYPELINELNPLDDPYPNSPATAFVKKKSRVNSVKGDKV